MCVRRVHTNLKSMCCVHILVEAFHHVQLEGGVVENQVKQSSMMIAISFCNRDFTFGSRCLTAVRIHINLLGLAVFLEINFRHFFCGTFQLAHRTFQEPSFLGNKQTGVGVKWILEMRKNR